MPAKVRIGVLRRRAFVGEGRQRREEKRSDQEINFWSLLAFFASFADHRLYFAGMARCYTKMWPWALARTPMNNPVQGAGRSDVQQSSAVHR